MTDPAALIDRFAREAPKLEPDLARAVWDHLWRALPRSLRRAERDRYLREAARLVGGSPWRKATTIAALLRAARRQGVPEIPNLDSPADLVALALRAYPGRPDRALSVPQVYRILCDSARLVEMQAPSSPSSQAKGNTIMSNRFEAGEDVREKFIRGATASILARSGHTGMIAAARSHPTLGDSFRKVDLDPEQYADASFTDLARTCLYLDGARSHHLHGEDLIRAALEYRSPANGMSDFAILLETAINKIYMGSYATTPVSWPIWCARRSTKDFRPTGFYRQGSFGRLDAVTDGEVKHKNVPDAAKNSITAGTAGNIIGIAHRALANDDVEAFRGIASALGEAAAFSIESDCYALLTANSGLGVNYPGDSNPLFYSSRSNIGPTGPMTAATIDGARAVMGKQKDPSGNRVISIRPAVWLGPEELGGAARILNAAEYVGAENTFREPNACRGLFSAVVDSPILSASSITRHYLLASPVVAPVFAVAFVNGREEPNITTQVRGPGLQMRVLIDYGTGVIDFRGGVTCAGQ